MPTLLEPGVEPPPGSICRARSGPRGSGFGVTSDEPLLRGAGRLVIARKLER